MTEDRRTKNNQCLELIRRIPDESDRLAALRGYVQLHKNLGIETRQTRRAKALLVGSSQSVIATAATAEIVPVLHKTPKSKAKLERERLRSKKGKSK